MIAAKISGIRTGLLLDYHKKKFKSTLGIKDITAHDPKFHKNCENPYGLTKEG